MKSLRCILGIHNWTYSEFCEYGPSSDSTNIITFPSKRRCIRCGIKEFSNYVAAYYRIVRGKRVLEETKQTWYRVE